MSILCATNRMVDWLVLASRLETASCLEGWETQHLGSELRDLGNLTPGKGLTNEADFHW